MENSYALIGLIGACIAIISLIVKYFVSAIRDKDRVIEEQNKKMTEMIEQNIESREHLDRTIVANTDATVKSMKATDNLSRLILQLIKKK